MFQSKLIRLLKIFSNEEINHFVQFLKSPLFNQGARPLKVQGLMEHLAVFHPDYPAAGISKEHVFEFIFPKEPYREEKLDKVASELVQVARKFIVSYCFPEAQSGQHHWMAQAQFFRQRGLEGEFRYAMEQLKKLQEATPWQEQEYLFMQFGMESERLKYLVSYNDWKSDINLPRIIESLDLYYIVSKMEYCSYLLAQGVNIRLETEQPFLLFEEVLGIARKNYLHVPIVAAYFNAITMLLQSDDSSVEAYRNLKTVLHENKGQLSLNTLKTLHSYMRNHIAVRYNQGDTACLPELFSLFKDHDQSGTLCQEDGSIVASTLQSAVTMALKLGEHAWATSFLERHYGRIAGVDDAEAIYQFHLANCAFHRGSFQEVEQWLRRNLKEGTTFREMFYNLAARRLEIKLLYETDSTQQLEKRVNAFKQFISDNRGTLSAKNLTLNNHFIGLLLKILQPKTLGNKARVTKLLEELRQEQAVAEREWLQQKLEALLPKR